MSTHTPEQLREAIEKARDPELSPSWEKMLDILTALLDLDDNWWAQGVPETYCLAVRAVVADALTRMGAL